MAIPPELHPLAREHISSADNEQTKHEQTKKTRKTTRLNMDSRELLQQECKQRAQ
jgi:hypothetical protein